jgi:hypothetical protein
MAQRDTTRSSSWDATEDHLTTNDTIPSATPSSSAAGVATSATPLLCLTTFSTDSVIAKGTWMVASSGGEFTSRSLARLPLDGRIAAQRRELLKRLGCYDEYAGVDAILDADDVCMEVDTPRAVASAASDASTPATSATTKELTARERNKYRRNAKSNEKRRRRQHTLEEEELEEEQHPANKKAKFLASSTAVSSADATDSSPPLLLETVADDTPTDDSSLFVLSDGSHILTPFVSRMLYQLVDVDWESRHGAALALRSVLMHHAARIGCDLRQGLTADQQAASTRSHQAFLSDTCARILCVLILDRFGDYASEPISYPVRETAAQILSLLATELDDTLLTLLIRHILQMAEQEDAELRYGAFIGLKYVLAVRFLSTDALILLPAPNVNVTILRTVMEPLIGALRDNSDDVRGMVAESLMHIIQCIVGSQHAESLISESQFIRLLSSLWSTLPLCDDLTSSTVQILDLLRTMYEWIARSRLPLSAAHVISPPPTFLTSAVVDLPLSTLLTRLFPFLDHALVTVKVNTWKTILTLIQLESTRSTNGAGAAVDDEHVVSRLTAVMRLAYESLLLESDESLHAICFTVWRFVADVTTDKSLHAVSDTQFLDIFDSLASPCMDLLMAPLFQPIQSHRLMRWNHSSSSSGALAHASLGRRVPVDSIPLVSSLDMKLRTSKAMGMMYHRLASMTPGPRAPPDTLPSPHFRLLRSHLLSPHDLCVQMTCLILCEWWHLSSTHPMSRHVAVCSAWVQTLHSIIDLSTSARARSANTKSLLAQALIQACEVQQHPSTYRAALLLCTEPLLFTIEFEQNFVPLQERCARYLSRLLRLLLRVDAIGVESIKRATPLGMSAFISSSDRLVADGILSRLIDLLCASIPAPLLATPTAPVLKPESVDVKMEMEDELSATEEQLLAMLQEDTKDSTTAAAAAAGAPSVLTSKVVSSSSSSATPAQCHAASPVSVAPTSGFIGERGARLFLIALCEQCDTEEDVFRVFPSLAHQHIGEGVAIMYEAHQASPLTAASRYALARSLHIIRHLVPHVPKQSHPFLLSLLPPIQRCLFIPEPISGSDELVDQLLPSLTREVIVSYAEHMTTPCMASVLRDLLPILQSAADTSTSSNSSPVGPSKIAVLALLQSLFAADLSVRLIPYLPFLLLPVLSCMSDVSSQGASDIGERIRSTACSVFGTMMTLLPLEVGIPSPSDMTPELHQQRLERRVFVQQLIDGSQVEEVVIPNGLLMPGVVLRKYQRDGIKWLRFLQQFHLHGILCDEMVRHQRWTHICSERCM